MLAFFHSRVLTVFQVAAEFPDMPAPAVPVFAMHLTAQVQ
jgi:hypothetical protein